MIVYTGGTFDLLHWGHVEFLKACHNLAGLGGKVIVSLNTDEFVATYKRAPVLSFEERRGVLLGCRWVREVVENSGGADSRPAIEAVKPDAIAIGSDWARRDYYSQMGFDQDWLDAQGIMLCYLPTGALFSTTEIRQRIDRCTSS